jgi:hypothetical protein
LKISYQQIDIAAELRKFGKRKKIEATKKFQILCIHPSHCKQEYYDKRKLNTIVAQEILNIAQGNCLPQNELLGQAFHQ